MLRRKSFATALLGSARVSRVGFGVAPKQAFHWISFATGGTKNTQKVPRSRDALANMPEACAIRKSMARRLPPAGHAHLVSVDLGPENRAYARA